VGEDKPSRHHNPDNLGCASINYDVGKELKEKMTRSVRLY